MNTPGADDTRGPRADQLAAYVDGELDGDARARVEAWLAEHADAVAEVEALRSLARICREAAPAEPAEPVWTGVLTRIEAALPADAVGHPRARRGWRLGTAAGLVAAAALVLAVVLYRPQPPTPPAEADPFPVVSADDVDIISIHAADTRALVVGEPPVTEPLALLLPNEVTVDSVSSAVQGMDPHYSREATAPMIIMVPRDDQP